MTTASHRFRPPITPKLEREFRAPLSERVGDYFSDIGYPIAEAFERSWFWLVDVCDATFGPRYPKKAEFIDPLLDASERAQERRQRRGETMSSSRSVDDSSIDAVLALGAYVGELVPLDEPRHGEIVSPQDATFIPASIAGDR